MAPSGDAPQVAAQTGVGACGLAVAAETSDSCRFHPRPHCFSEEEFMKWDIRLRRSGHCKGSISTALRGAGRAAVVSMPGQHPVPRRPRLPGSACCESHPPSLSAGHTPGPELAAAELITRPSPGVSQSLWRRYAKATRGRRGAVLCSPRSLTWETAQPQPCGSAGG